MESKQADKSTAGAELAKASDSSRANGSNSGEQKGGTVVIAPGPSAVCVFCSQPIGDQWVPFNDSVCHPQCFCCQMCGENVEEKYCVLDDPEGRHLLCETHYFERTNMVCARCKEPLDTTYVQAMGRKYHPDHFTCTACPTVFGPDGTYYEHEGDAYCLYHYTYLVAKKCAGCQQPIMKLFLQMNHRGVEEHWHPECYMIYKFWNVRISPSMYAGGRGRVNKQLLRPQNAVSEQQIYQIWTVLSSFEESTAACISDMLLQVSGGRYLEGLRQAERFIMHVDVLFASIDDLEDELSHFDDSTGLQHTREPKLLCKKIVSFFSVLSHTQSNESNGLTQELLSLVTSLAHYLKVLTRVALKGALKAQTEYKCPASIKALLSKLTETSDRQKWALFRLSYQETDIASDLCTTCRSPVETECIEHMRKRKRWHLYCFVCSSCSSEIQHVYPQSALDEAAGTLLCPSCSSKNGVAPGGFKFVSQLEQYSFLMRVALKRLYGLLKMKNAVENPGLARLKKGDIAKELGDLTDLKQIVESPQLSEKDAAAVKEVNREFDSALSQLDKLELQSGTATPVDIDRSKQQQQQPQTQAGGRTPVMPGTTPPVNADMLNAVAKAAVKEAKNEGSLVHVVDAYNEASPPQVLADRRKPRMGHTTVHAVKARMESHKPSSPILQAPGSSQFPLPAMRRASPMANSQLSVSALAAQQQSASGNASQTPSTLSGKPSKLQRVSDDSEPSRTTATSEAETACKVKNMLSRSHTMRFVSDLNTAELFCAKHVAVSRLASLLGQTDISQADLVALIGTPKKTSASNMWSRLKTNLMKKDGSAGGNAGSANGKDHMRTATFGVPLETLLERQGVETDLGAHGQQKLQVPQFFEQMLTTLSSMDLAVEGIFRKNGNIRRLREVTDDVDKDFSRVDLKKDTPVQIAALLKKFLRELPDPLIPFRMRRLFLAIAAIQNQRDRIEAYRYAIVLMPQGNRDMLNVLMTFLNWVATFSHVNEQSGSKMDALNLATVITPNILYADVKEPTRGDRDDTFSYMACNVIQQFMEAGDTLWMVPDAVIVFLRDNSSEFIESTNELNTKELLRRCEKQLGAIKSSDSAD
ncbi:Rho-type GTPase activating protein Rga1 [Coemansia sp. RSA 989]|nr:Rho-type GTPase activating protein Rga1 [Coemansia sp. RSA 1086]KAJ1749115.1 Rho-type GTPase activating protein Rga1 [Coemansia sp. RSA 1821]KAJ1863200.1 Rho-type GTPase activating protein Rga1 [Coemansia sp. RSA 989]KAJ1870991.1 Rho-type GTPase activating protein Rga1 [Coemansia sp. RSA 990]KAJ2646658.1 Rho-type GTPase activating protein Rga1 [Coemansia sp. RSA 1250]